MTNSINMDTLRNHSVVVMPDFFIDRIVRLKSQTEDVFKTIQESLDTRGGNALNITYCLA